MDLQISEVEPVTVSDVLGLASWDRPRTSEELQNFITSHHAALPDSTEIE